MNNYCTRLASILYYFIVLPVTIYAQNIYSERYYAAPTVAMVEEADSKMESMSRRAVSDLLYATSAETVNGITWTYYIDDEDNAVIGTQEEKPAIANTTSGAVTIPNKLGGKTVVTIGDYALATCDKMTSVTIPSTVKTIGKSAFYRCGGLTSLTIPNGVKTILNDAFWYCWSVKSLTIPASVETIGNCAFAYWYALTSLKVSSDNKIFDSRNNCNAVIETATNTMKVTCQNTVIPSTVTTLGDYAFFGCGNLESITIPKTVTSIGVENFNCCYALKTIKVEDANIIYDSRDNCNAIIETEKNTLIAGCKTSVIPNTVTKIGYCAFWGCHNLSTITIPNSVTELDNSAFGICVDLIEISLPNSIKRIGWQAFYGCQKLTSIFIPVSVNFLGNKAFAVCTSMTSMKVDETNPYFDSRNECNAIILTSQNRLCSGCQTTYIPDDIESITNYAFYGCYTLKAINIPNSVSSIGEFAFGGVPATIGGYAEEGDIDIDGIMCYIKDPYEIDNNVFQNYTAKLYVPKGTKTKYESTYAWSNFNIIEEMEDDPVCDSDDLQKWIDLLGRRGESGTVADPTEVPPCGEDLTIDDDVDVDDVQIFIDGTGQNPRHIICFFGGYLNVMSNASIKFKSVGIDGKTVSPTPQRAATGGGGIKNYGSLTFSDCSLSSGSYIIDNQTGGYLYVQDGSIVEGTANVINSGTIITDGSCAVNGIEHKYGGRIIIMGEPIRNINVNINDAKDIEIDEVIVRGLLFSLHGDGQSTTSGHELTEEDVKMIKVTVPDGYEAYFNTTQKGICIRVSTGIADLTTEHPTVLESFDLSGRKTIGIRNGMTIQRMSNGTVNKVFMNQ